LLEGEFEIEDEMRLRRSIDEEESRGVHADFVHDLGERDDVSLALAHLDRLGAAFQRHVLREQDFERTWPPKRSDERLQSVDVTVMVGPEDVEQEFVTALELVAMVRGIGREIRRAAVAAPQDAILLVAEFRRPEEKRPVLFVGMPASFKLFEHVRDLAAVVKSGFRKPGVEVDAESLHVPALAFDDDVASKPPEDSPPFVDVRAHPA